MKQNNDFQHKSVKKIVENNKHELEYYSSTWKLSK